MDFNNSGAMRSPFSPRVRQSIAGRRPIGLSSAKKNQSKFMQSSDEPSGDVIYKTPMTTVQTYGQPLPVMVTETLAFASGEVSVRVSPCGWCWVVSGRRVVAWPLVAQPSHAPAHTLAARELTLPQTDLAHKADLVVLFYEDGAQMPSCIGVSPEGVVRYWACVGQEGVFSDASAELAGQECDRLAEPSPLGLLLATTTCTAVLLTPAQVEGRATVVCRTLRPPSGWLGGLGRRVSLLFFGSMPAHADTKLVGAVVLPSGGGEGGEGEGEGGEACVALVARGPVVQTWRGPQLHLHEHNLRRTLTDAHARAHLAPHGDLNSLEIMGLDVRGDGSTGLLLLMAAVNVARSPDMRYAIGHISLEEASAPRVTSLVPLRSWSAEAEEAPRFLPLGPRALIYTSNYIALVSMTVSNDKVDFIDVSADGDKILGAELCNGLPLLFSRKHGVLALSISDTLAPTPSLCDSPLGSPCPSDMYDGNLSLYEIDPHEVSMVTTDACGKLKTAFLFHVRRDSLSCRAILDELFPPPRAPPPPHHPHAPRPTAHHPDDRDLDVDVDVDSVLDRTVLKIATEMLDDIPAGDPRWRQPAVGPHTYIALGRSAALQLAAQLRDKQRAFSLFIDFLRATGLWQRLGLVTKESGSGDGCVPSSYLLCQLGECLAAALALRRLQQGPDAAIIDAAVYQVVCGENPEVEEEPEVEEALAAGGLAPADVCFRRVSRIRRVLRALALSQPSTAPHATHTIHILTSALTEMHKCRAQWQSAAPPPPPGPGASPPGPPPPPLGPRALLPALADLHKRAVTECAHKCPEASQRAAVLEAAARLADLVLTEASRLHSQHIYERMRTQIIQPYIEEGQTERAAALAEKFKDFDLLIEMCVNNDDLDRLYTYIDNYSNEGMCEATFAWLAQRGGGHWRTLVQRVGGRGGVGGTGGRLAAWLAAAPARAPLLALHHLAAPRPDHAAAAHLLAQLADQETHSLSRMMTTASLAKLCLVASEDYDSRPSDTWRKIEGRLALGEQHEALPRDIKLHNGLDTEDTRVMRPEDLVQMYVESESKSLTEYDYKKALDLTDYIQDMELRDDLRLKVWCACIKRDDWSACRVDAPADEMQNKMFFRLIDLVHVMGGDLELVLPPVEDILTARELVDLVSDPRFHFIIKYGYECLDNSRNDSMEQ